MLRFIVGASAGGGFDTYTRLLARHVGKHIPGNPSTIVANMPGAGHLIAANYMYAKAKPDGLTIGNWVGGLVFKQVAGQGQGIRFDARKFEWVGLPVSDSMVCLLSRKRASAVSRIGLHRGLPSRSGHFVPAPSRRIFREF